MHYILFLFYFCFFKIPFFFFSKFSDVFLRYPNIFFSYLKHIYFFFLDLSFFSKFSFSFFEILVFFFFLPFYFFTKFNFRFDLYLFFYNFFLWIIYFFKSCIYFFFSFVKFFFVLFFRWRYIIVFLVLLICYGPFFYFKLFHIIFNLITDIPIPQSLTQPVLWENVKSECDKASSIFMQRSEGCTIRSSLILEEFNTDYGSNIFYWLRVSASDGPVLFRFIALYFLSIFYKVCFSLTHETFFYYWFFFFTRYSYYFLYFFFLICLFIY